MRRSLGLGFSPPSSASSVQRLVRVSELVIGPLRRNISYRCCCCTRSVSLWTGEWSLRGRAEAEERTRRRRRSPGVGCDYKRRAMSNGSEAAVMDQAEAGGRGAEKAAVADAVKANGGGRGDKNSALQQQRNGSAADGKDEDAAVGFARPEMHSEALVGTVQYFQRHLFLCCKGPESWPSSVEASSEHFDRLPNRLAGALKARKTDMPLKTRLTICEESAGPGASSAGDVLVFPEMVRYKSLAESDVEEFVEGALVAGGKEWEAGGFGGESLSGSYVFVCSHGSRDKRCGSCGPVLIEKLREEIRMRGLEDQIFVRACSHIGGHKYAGNVIVFSSSESGVAGHWYGYVSPADVPLILDQHIGKGEIIERLWRGQMGVSEADQKAAQLNRLRRAEDAGNSCCQSGSSEQANGVNQCGGGGSGCCQSTNEQAVQAVEENKIPEFLVSAGTSAHDGHLVFPEDADTDEEPADPRIRLWGNFSIPLPKWVQTWEKEDTNAALAVVGAGAAVAVAFHIWRQSSSSSSS